VVAAHAHDAASLTQSLRGKEWRVLGTLVPYLWEYRWRVAAALALLVAAKLTNVMVPLVIKEVVDGLDPKLAVPRRASPRAVVPAGSVAIANEQTVVYPYAISGGWNVIGRTPMVLFDASRTRPSLLWPGDRVRFRAITRAEFIEMAAGQ